MRWSCLVLIAGCYSPQYAPGGTCTSTCPGDLECVQGTCVIPGTLPLDPDGGAGVDAVKITTDAAIDARMIDAPPPDPTLIAHWTFDTAPANGTVPDVTANGHDGACVATACPSFITDGPRAGAYRFDPGLNQHIVVPDSNALHASSFTIAAWMYTDNTVKSISVMAKPYGSGTGNSWQLENRDDDRVSFSGGAVHLLQSQMAVPIMTWTHIAGTYDDMTKTKRLYINGVMIASTLSPISYDGSDVYLGADENDGSLALPFDGALDDLRFYSRVLSAQELQTLAAP